MRLSRRARYGLLGAGLFAVWAGLVLLVDSRTAREIVYALVEAAEGAFGQIGERASIALIARSLEMFIMGLMAATLATPIALVARAHARSRLRATGRDLLASLRARVAKPSRRLRAATWLPAAAGAAITTMDPIGRAWTLEWQALALLATVPAAFAITALVRRYLALLAAPPARPEDLVLAGAGEDEIYFSAVAVTREARGLVAGFAVATLGVMAALVALPVTTLAENGLPFLAVYGALAASAAAAYHRASRIAVGTDGVFVTGTSRRRFFAYRDLEAAEIASSGEIVLRAGGRVKLRLQLIGGDAPRMEAIVARMAAGIERARAQGADGAQRFMETATAKSLAKAAHGRGDYRERAVSREDLLTIVESPATTAEGRAAAAAALERAANATEHARLRIAAERCAEPEARAMLLRIAGDRPEDEAALETAEDEAAIGARAAQRARS